MGCGIAAVPAMLRTYGFEPRRNRHSSRSWFWAHRLFAGVAVVLFLVAMDSPFMLSIMGGRQGDRVAVEALAAVW